MIDLKAMDTQSMAFSILLGGAHKLSMGVMPMKCAWESFVKQLPLWMREKVDKLGNSNLRELRMRINAPPELVLQGRSVFLDRNVSREDIEFSINLATKYSPWASESVANGYITIPGGHRIGLCGIVTSSGQSIKGFSSVSSICIRISRDFPGIAKSAAVSGSILIIGKPGSGKTTFLRDLVRQISKNEGSRVVVVDERHEIFPYAGGVLCFGTNARVDVIAGCSKAYGIETALRNMTPTMIAVDEITARTDSDAMIQSIGCGVSLLATAHASCVEDLKARPIYRLLQEYAVFDTVVILHSDMTWHMEKM